MSADRVPADWMLKRGSGVNAGRKKFEINKFSGQERKANFMGLEWGGQVDLPESNKGPNAAAGELG